jgi:hypothetical protein
MCFCWTGCVSKKYIFVQNKTEHDIYIYKTVIYDIPENDSLMRMIMQKNSLYDNYKEGKLTMNYYKILKPDSLAFLDIVHGEKSKTELIDSNKYYFFSPLMIVSNSDTIWFSQEKIMQKVNEAWSKRDSNSSVKLKAHEKTRLIWEFRNDSLTK